MEADTYMIIRSDTKMKDIAEFYGLTFKEEDLKLTITEFLVKKGYPSLAIIINQQPLTT